MFFKLYLMVTVLDALTPLGNRLFMVITGAALEMVTDPMVHPVSQKSVAASLPVVVAMPQFVEGYVISTLEPAGIYNSLTVMMSSWLVKALVRGLLDMICIEVSCCQQHQISINSNNIEGPPIAYII